MDQQLRKPIVTGVDFPPNSNRSKQRQAAPVEKKPLQPIVTTPVSRRKKSLGKKFVETFISEDISDVRRYIIHDVLIPAMKNTLIEMFSGGSQMMFSGNRINPQMRRVGGQSVVSYQNYSNQPQNNQRVRTDQNRVKNDFADILFTHRGEAEAVLSALVDSTIDYQQVSVSDFYQLVGIATNYTDDKYGWFELGRATVSRVSGGYIINLPRPVLLD